MKVQINGKSETFPEPLGLDKLAASKGLQPERIVIELNQRIVARGQWPGVILKDGDVLEIITFMAGG